MRGDQLARQWQLIQRLAKSRSGAALDDLAEELGCVRRTVYRDLDALMFAGFPVVSERREGRVYYRFLDTFRLGDVPFTPDEILALAFSEDLLRPRATGTAQELRAVSRHDPDPERCRAQSAHAPHALPDRKNRVRSNPGSGSLPGVVSKRRALRGGPRSQVRRDSHLRGRSNPPTRSWCRLFRGARKFRFRQLHRLFVRRFEPRWATYVEERNWHESQTFAKGPDGKIEISMDVGSTPDLRSWILSFGSGAEVLEPEELRTEVARELEEARVRYESAS